MFNLAVEKGKTNVLRNKSNFPKKKHLLAPIRRDQVRKPAASNVKNYCKFIKRPFIQEGFIRTSEEREKLNLKLDHSKQKPFYFCQNKDKAKGF